MGPAASPTDAGLADGIAADPHCDDDQAMKDWIALVERQLSAICGFDAKQTTLHSGRADGAGFKWADPCGSPAQANRRATPFTRAWRSLAGWILEAKGLVVKMRGVAPTPGGCGGGGAGGVWRSVVWRILFHDFRLPAARSHWAAFWPSDGDAAVQETEILTFRSGLTEGMLGCPAALQRLFEIASERAHTLERKAVADAARELSKWLREGPADGLGRQHRLSKTAQGWIPTPVAQQELVQLSAEDHVEECTPSQLADIQQRELSRLGCLPLNVQQVANAEAAVWSKQWRVGETVDPLAWPDDMDDRCAEMEDMNAGKLRDALRSFPAGTGLGWDDLHPRALLRLPDSTLMALLRILRRCERDGSWPAAAGFVVIALIPKAD